MSETIVDREPERRKVERELGRFRIWFSILTFLLTAVAFAIGFPALEDAGKKIGLGNLAFGLPFAIDLGMVTLLLWSMWNRGTLKPWWPPIIPAGLLLALSSWLQYIHAVELISEETPVAARWGLLILASALPLLLALSAGVFEAVTFAPLIDRAKRHTQLMLEQQKADDELWRIEMEQRRANSELEAQIKRSRIEIENRTQLQLIEAEAEAATRALKGSRSSTKSAKSSLVKIAEPKPTESKSVLAQGKPLEETTLMGPEAKGETSVESEAVAPSESQVSSAVDPNTNDPMEAAIQAVRSGTLSQRKAAEQFQVPRSALRRRLEE